MDSLETILVKKCYDFMFLCVVWGFVPFPNLLVKHCQTYRKVNSIPNTCLPSTWSQHCHIHFFSVYIFMYWFLNFSFFGVCSAALQSIAKLVITQAVCPVKLELLQPSD